MLKTLPAANTQGSKKNAWPLFVATIAAVLNKSKGNTHVSSHLIPTWAKEITTDSLCLAWRLHCLDVVHRL